ncbi:F-box protein At3g56470-like [Lotus japonicus]|uniref:F-box protein At3g56470-like n=1 Tax=Lotus japonicus TaxID=34305 RepID=UPI002586F3A1|nr:F-box protein At3g56470-like [Lotus japonicus]
MKAAGAKKFCSSKFCIKKVQKNNDLPLDVLGIIYRKLDLGDLFKFAGVCKSWRITHKHYLSSFMEIQSPFIVEITSKAKKVCSFYSIPDLMICRLMMPYFSGYSYCASSSGYMILAGKNTLLLVNPFTRKEQVISTSAIKDTFDSWSCRALLAFAKGSEEFVIVISSCRDYDQLWSLNVYQSRNSCWVGYSIGSDPWKGCRLCSSA